MAREEPVSRTTLPANLVILNTPKGEKLLGKIG
jgi:hypothetical protein